VVNVEFFVLNEAVCYIHCALKTLNSFNLFLMCCEVLCYQVLNPLVKFT